MCIVCRLAFDLGMDQGYMYELILVLVPDHELCNIIHNGLLYNTASCLVGTHDIPALKEVKPVMAVLHCLEASWAS